MFIDGLIDQLDIMWTSDVVDTLCDYKIYLGILLAFAFCMYYLIEVVKTPLFVCPNGYFRDFLEEHVPTLKRKFWPTIWCFESYAHTIFASLIRESFIPDVHYRREILTLPDGGELALDWAEENCTETSPIVIILPGMTGTSKSEYVKCLVFAARSLRIKCVVFNYRGLSGVKLKTPRLYCASNSEDFITCLNYVRQLQPNVPVAATGISYGGLTLGNYLAHRGPSAVGTIKAALAISAPLNVIEGTKCFEKPFLNILLNKWICKVLRNSVGHKLHELESMNFDHHRIRKSELLREFDEHFTTKQFGYKDVDEYYALASLHDKLHRIEVPFLCVNAADDPIQPLEHIPLKETLNTKHVAMFVPLRGGHIGFLEGLWPVSTEQYIGKIFSEFFNAVFTTGKIN